MSHQNAGEGYSGSRGRGRSSRPNSRPSHHYRHDGVDKPFANNSFGSKDGVSQGRGRYAYHAFPGMGSRHFNDKRTSNLVYRPKRPTPDVVPNFVETEGSQMKESVFSETSYAVHDDEIHSLCAHSDHKNIYQDVSRTQIEETPKKETKDIATVSHDLSLLGKVKGEGLPELTSLTKADTKEVDVSGIQIGETPKKETEDISGVILKYSFSSKVEVKFKQESPLPAKTDTKDWTSKEKGANSLARTGDSEHSVQQTQSESFDICPPTTGASFQLKPSFLVTNKQKRNEVKLAHEGQNGSVLRSGMVLLEKFLSISDQLKIVKKCRELGLGHGGFYQPCHSDEGRLHLKMMCLGKNWDPKTRKYGDIRTIDRAKPPIIPVEFNHLVEKALEDSHALIGRNAEAELPWMSPNICLVNFYSTTGRLGLHQDRDESRESLDERLPVVSFSIGDSAEFLYGDQSDVDKAEKAILKSGDVLIFGGKSRHIFHGVSKIIRNTAPPVLQEQTNFRPGRLNLTFRHY